MQPKRVGYFGRFSAAVYRLISLSHLGRWLMGYRREPTTLLPGEKRARLDSMPSARRTALTAAAEQSRILRLFRWLARVLADAPARLYGLFFLLYGLTCGIIRLVRPLLSSGREPEILEIFLCGVIALAACPLAWTRRSLAAAVCGGHTGHAFFCRLLGVPEERIGHATLKVPVWFPYGTAILGVGAAFLSTILHPSVVPLAVLVLGLIGLVLSFPEVGVSLSALMFPFIWVWDMTLYLLAALILLTWVSFGVKLALMHRSFRFGRLDALVSLMGLLLLCGGVFSTNFSAEGMQQGCLFAILLSDYFLIVNLTDSRATVKRCIAGLSGGIAILLLLFCVQLIPINATHWYEHYLIGSVLTDGARQVAVLLDGLWSAGFEQFFLLALPWLLMLLLSCRRLRTGLPVLGMICLCGWMILRSGSVLGGGIALLSLMLFALLCGHQALTVIISILPLVVTGGLWYTYFHPLSELVDRLDGAIRVTSEECARVWPGVARMVRELPMGIGLGETAFRSVYPQYAEPGAAQATSAGSLYLDLLAALGVVGLVTVVVLLVLFFRKSFTYLGRCRVGWDRTVLAAGICTVLNYMLLGTVRSVGSSPQLFFCVVMVMGLCSALSAVGLEEQDVLIADRCGETPEREDRFLWLDNAR